jgi:hypothetical protein
VPRDETAYVADVVEACTRAGLGQGTQLKALPVPVPEQAPAAHPAQEAHRLPETHCESLVHQQGTPAAVQTPLGDVTVSQLPIEHDQANATEVTVSQSSLS